MNSNNQHPDTSELYEYLDGELQAGELQTLEEHLAQCPACSTRLVEIQSLYTRITESPERLPSRDLSQVVLARLARLAKLKAHDATPTVERKTWRIIDFSTAIQALAALVLLGIALPSVYRTLIARSLDWLSTQASADLTFWLKGLAVTWEQWRLTFLGSLEQIREFHAQPVLVGQLPILEIIAILALATVIWLASNGYLLGIWNTPSVRRKL